MRERSFDSVVRRKVLIAVAPLGALVFASLVAVSLGRNGYASLAVTISLGASWIAFVFRHEIFERGDRAGHYVTGLRSERATRQALVRLENRCFVKNDIRVWNGNIDHVVCGPSGAFLIDTKTNRYRFPDLAIARRRAKWLSDRLEGHWVTPVICLVKGRRAPYEHQRVWVVGVDELVEWLEARRDRPVDPVFARRVLGER
jgi:nuclease-like protein